MRHYGKDLKDTPLTPDFATRGVCTQTNEKRDWLCLMGFVDGVMYFNGVFIGSN